MDSDLKQGVNAMKKLIAIGCIWLMASGCVASQGLSLLGPLFFEVAYYEIVKSSADVTPEGAGEDEWEE